MISPFAGLNTVSATTQQYTGTNLKGPAACFCYCHSCKRCSREAGGENQVGWNGLGQQDVHHRWLHLAKTLRPACLCASLTSRQIHCDNAITRTAVSETFGDIERKKTHFPVLAQAAKFVNSSSWNFLTANCCRVPDLAGRRWTKGQSECHRRKCSSCSTEKIWYSCRFYDQTKNIQQTQNIFSDPPFKVKCMNCGKSTNETKCLH